MAGTKRGAKPETVVSDVLDQMAEQASGLMDRLTGHNDGTCPHCGGDLSSHADGLRTHCDACGCCFDVETMTPRPGHPLCAKELARANA